MEQEIINPETQPQTGSQAFSPLGCFLAASGATMLSFTMLGSAMMATVWATSQLFGLPDTVMYGVMAIAAIPVLWVTLWTAGRAWHVERRLAQGLDIDVPEFKTSAYLKRS